MPGWQRFFEEHHESGLQVVAVAVDVQGVEKVSPWIKRAGATFPCLVDAKAELGARFHINYVPFSILIDEDGKLVRAPQPVNITKRSHRDNLVAWITDGTVQPAAAPSDAFFNEPATSLLMSRAVHFWRNGDKPSSLADLRAALEFDPENWLVRKQIWAIENPQRFYSGPVDFSWQRKQLEVERRAPDSG